jgi:hypothetical protein
MVCHCMCTCDDSVITHIKPIICHNKLYNCAPSIHAKITIYCDQIKRILATQWYYLWIFIDSYNMFTDNIYWYQYLLASIFTDINIHWHQYSSTITCIVSFLHKTITLTGAMILKIMMCEQYYSCIINHFLFDSISLIPLFFRYYEVEFSWYCVLCTLQDYFVSICELFLVSIASRRILPRKIFQIIIHHILLHIVYCASYNFSMSEKQCWMNNQSYNWWEKILNDSNHPQIC